MRNHFLRAAAGNLGGPVFLDATANSGDEVTWSSSDITVSTGDYFVLFSFGENLNDGDVIANGTSTFTIANTIIAGSGGGLYRPGGDGGNDHLAFEVFAEEVTADGSVRAQGLAGDPVSSGGVVVGVTNVSSFGIQYAGGVTTSSSSNTISIASLNTGVVIYIGTRQTIDGSTPGGREPSLPSGFTTTGGNTYFTSGAGGGSHEWYLVSGYKKVSDGESFSHTLSANNDFLDYGLAINIYNT